MSPFFLFVLFVFGTAFGSFLNVLAFRYDRCETANDANLRIRKMIGGRSRCMRCGTQLRWYELLPLISFVFLRGRCRTCGEKISWQYPIVELLSGLIFVFVVLQLPNYPITIQLLWILVFLLLLLMSIIDIRHYLIPDELSFSFLVLGFFGVFLKTFISPFQQFFVGSYAVLFGIPSTSSGNIITIFLFHGIGFLVGGGFFWAVYALSKGKGIGFGDVKLAFALGLLLGWPDIFFAMMFAFFFGGVWGVLALLLRKKGFKSRLPFGPFFALGVLWLVFFGEATMRWYFNLFRT